MAVNGRKLPFAGIAKAIDCVTATKGWSRPKSVIQASCRERRLWDRKQAIEIRLLQAAQTSSNRINEGHRQGCLVLNETI